MIGRVVHGLVIGGLCKTQFYVYYKQYNNYTHDGSNMYIAKHSRGKLLGFSWFFTQLQTFPMNYGLFE